MILKFFLLTLGLPGLCWGAQYPLSPILQKYQPWKTEVDTILSQIYYGQDFSCMNLNEIADWLYRGRTPRPQLINTLSRQESSNPAALYMLGMCDFRSNCNDGGYTRIKQAGALGIPEALQCIKQYYSDFQRYFPQDFDKEAILDIKIQLTQFAPDYPAIMAGLVHNQDLTEYEKLDPINWMMNFDYQIKKDEGIRLNQEILSYMRVNLATYHRDLCGVIFPSLLLIGGVIGLIFVFTIWSSDIEVCSTLCGSLCGDWKEAISKNNTAKFCNQLASIVDLKNCESKKVNSKDLYAFVLATLGIGSIYCAGKTFAITKQTTIPLWRKDCENMAKILSSYMMLTRSSVPVGAAEKIVNSLKTTRKKIDIDAGFFSKLDQIV